MAASSSALGMRIAEFTLLLEQYFQFVSKQDARKRFAVIALLVALRIREFCQHHFGRGAVVFLQHQLLGASKSLFDLAAFALCRLPRLFLRRG